MSYQGKYDVGVVFDTKIETPSPGKARLPDIIRFVIFLGTERGMTDVLQ